MLRTAHLLHPASTPTSRPTPGAILPGTLASPRTGLAPAGCRELVARLRHGVVSFLTAPELLDAHRWNWPSADGDRPSPRSGRRGERHQGMARGCRPHDDEPLRGDQHEGQGRSAPGDRACGFLGGTPLSSRLEVRRNPARPGCPPLPGRAAGRATRGSVGRARCPSHVRNPGSVYERELLCPGVRRRCLGRTMRLLPQRAKHYLRGTTHAQDGDR